MTQFDAQNFGPHGFYHIWICYVTQQKNFADRIKVTNHLTLKCKNMYIPDYWGGLLSSHGPLKAKEGGTIVNRKYVIEKASEISPKKKSVRYKPWDRLNHLFLAFKIEKKDYK